MQTPDKKTPVPKNHDLAAYSARMLGKFTANPVLMELAARMLAAGEGLAASQRVYKEAVLAILPARVDVKYENFVSDQRIRRTLKKAELADDRANGPIVTAVFPNGANAIIRLQGKSQVEAMVDLEGNLDAAKALWPDAVNEMAEVREYRERYDAAILGRRAAGQAARNLRVERDAERARFLMTYAEIASRVQAEFPRDKAMQDLFFDDVRTRSTAEQAEGDEDVPEDDAAAPPPA